MNGRTRSLQKGFPWCGEGLRISETRLDESGKFLEVSDGARCGRLEVKKFVKAGVCMADRALHVEKQDAARHGLQHFAHFRVQLLPLSVGRRFARRRAKEPFP